VQVLVQMQVQNMTDAAAVGTSTHWDTLLRVPLPGAIRSQHTYRTLVPVLAGAMHHRLMWNHHHHNSNLVGNTQLSNLVN